MSWLDPLRRALDEAPRAVELFIRDDDAGWQDDRLLALLEMCAARGLPLDLAVIPVALTPALARVLVARAESAPLGLHQHGFAHVNHETAGRKCEFGPSRDREAQRRDIAEGRWTLEQLLGDHLDPIFTPPWNRCTRATGECLATLGFAALSRESRAEPLGVDGLAELPVAVDWFAHRKGARLTQRELAERVAAAPEPVGIMFHHAVMDDGEMARAGELLDLLAAHPEATVRPMAELVAAAAVRGGDLL